MRRMSKILRELNSAHQLMYGEIQTLLREMRGQDEADGVAAIMAAGMKQQQQQRA